jgi:hypothetical protein
VVVQVAVSLLLLVAGCSGQQYVLTPPYFNIAEKRYGTNIEFLHLRFLYTVPGAVCRFRSFM